MQPLSDLRPELSHCPGFHLFDWNLISIPCYPCSTHFNCHPAFFQWLPKPGKQVQAMLSTWKSHWACQTSCRCISQHPRRWGARPQMVSLHSCVPHHHHLCLLHLLLNCTQQYVGHQLHGQTRLALVRFASDTASDIDISSWISNHSCNIWLRVSDVMRCVW